MNDDDVAQQRKVVLDGLREVELRFREERARHSAAVAPIREELWRLVEQGDALGLSITSMAKEIKVSRGRLKRMIQRLGSPLRAVAEGARLTGLSYARSNGVASIRARFARQQFRPLKNGLQICGFSVA